MNTILYGVGSRNNNNNSSNNNNGFQVVYAAHIYQNRLPTVWIESHYQILVRFRAGRGYWKQTKKRFLLFLHSVCDSFCWIICSRFKQWLDFEAVSSSNIHPKLGHIVIKRTLSQRIVSCMFYSKRHHPLLYCFVLVSSSSGVRCSRVSLSFEALASACT